MKLTAALTGLALALSAPFAAAQGLPDLAGREIVVVTENAYPPLQYLKDGVAKGWEYDAMAELATRLNFTVKYENISWDAMIAAVSEGQYDMGMTGITIREDRREKVDFSEPYMRSEMVMLVRGDEARFADAAALLETLVSCLDVLSCSRAGVWPCMARTRCVAIRVQSSCCWPNPCSRRSYIHKPFGRGSICRFAGAITLQSQ